MVGQLGQALNPFLISFGLVYRRRMCLIAGIMGQIVVFSMTGFKTAALCAIFLALVAVFVKRWRHNFGLALTAGVIGLVLVAAVADRATGNIFFNSIITRRALVVPGLLTGFYLEHYSHVPPVGVGLHLSHDESVIGPANEIGLTYFGNADVNANANLWAEGFAEFGVPGIVGFTLFLAFMLWLYDSLASRRDLQMSVLLAAMPAIMLSNTSPLTVVISHGGLAAALLLYLSPSPALPDQESAPEPALRSNPLDALA